MAHTPETSAAYQVLYAMASKAEANGRAILFRAILRLSRGRMTMAHIERQWKATR